MGHVLVAGAGIGGLAVALACARAGHSVQVLEQSRQLSEVGAGIQLGPNAVRRLDAWGLAAELARVASWPQRLELHSADRHRLLGQMPLGAAMQLRYGYGYATLHRADLQQLLLAAVQAEAGVELVLGHPVTDFEQSEHGVRLHCAGQVFAGDVLLAADGVWSGVREQLLNDRAARSTGHVAYRALIDAAAIPPELNSSAVHAWMGPHMHAVAYPVSGGSRFNLVLIAEQRAAAVTDEVLRGWDGASNRATVLQAAVGMRGLLPELLQSVDSWRQWPLYDRMPVRDAAELALGRVALLGDAAHPMRPYLAQGAAMALEDAAELGARLRGCTGTAMAAALGAYAAARWQRVARVQRRAQHNGRIFHATGLVRFGRDASLGVLGQRLLDLPWLYAG